MKKEFLPYQLALELKELGFNEECLALWQSKRKGEPYININSPKNIKALLSCSINNSDVEYIVSAPLWQQAFDWFREKYEYSIEITYCFLRNDLFTYMIKENPYSANIISPLFDNTMELSEEEIISNILYKSFDEARLECLKKLIEIAKKQK